MSNVEPSEFHALRDEVREMRRDMQELVQAWQTAQGVVRFVRWIGNVTKWIAGVVAAVVALWALLKMGIKS